MSRRAALWSAAGLTVIAVLVFGSVLLQPTFNASADEAGAPTVVVLDQPADLTSSQESIAADEWYEDDEHDDDEGGERHDDHDDEDDDDD
jgi:hypothetical protein